MTPKLWLLVFVAVPVATYLLTAVRCVSRNTRKEWRRGRYERKPDRTSSW